LVFRELQRTREVVKGQGIIPKLQKTQHIIWIWRLMARHLEYTLEERYKDFIKNPPISQKNLKRNRRFWCFIDRPTHDRLAALRQASRIPRKGNNGGGGKTWPASPFLFLEATSSNCFLRSVFRFSSPATLAKTFCWCRFLKPSRNHIHRKNGSNSCGVCGADGPSTGASARDRMIS
jgi:hypothetical protein